MGRILISEQSIAEGLTLDEVSTIRGARKGVQFSYLPYDLYSPLRRLGLIEPAPAGVPWVRWVVTAKGARVGKILAERVAE